MYANIKQALSKKWVAQRALNGADQRARQGVDALEKATLRAFDATGPVLTKSLAASRALRAAPSPAKHIAEERAQQLYDNRATVHGVLSERLRDEKQWDTLHHFADSAHRDTMLPLIHEGHALADRGTRMGIPSMNGTLSPATDAARAAIKTSAYTAGVTDMFRRLGY